MIRRRCIEHHVKYGERWSLLLSLSLLIAVTFQACSVAHDAASATYHAVTAPVRIIKRQVVRKLPPGTRMETTTATVVARTIRTNLPQTATPPSPATVLSRTHGIWQQGKRPMDGEDFHRAVEIRFNPAHNFFYETRIYSSGEYNSC